MIVNEISFSRWETISKPYVTSRDDWISREQTQDLEDLFFKICKPIKEIKEREEIISSLEKHLIQDIIII